MTKAIEIVSLTRIEGANLNSAGTEGVISVLKKTEDINGREYIRISGQSVKYQIREIWRNQNLSTSRVISRAERGEKVIVSEGKPVGYIDDDLFGYMIAGDRRRTAPVRSNGMISLFPYKGDRDFGVRYDPKGKEHNIYEVEVTTNIMRGNIFIELDRLGRFTKEEIGEDKELSTEEKEKRLKALFDALFNFFGGAHLSNYFTKVYPEVFLVVILERKLPVIGDKLVITGKVDSGRYILEKDRLIEAISTFDANIKEVLIGGFESVIENWSKIKELANDKIKVFSLKGLMQEITTRRFYS